MKLLWRQLIAVILLAAIGVVGINIFVLAAPKGVIYRQVSEVPHKQAALVLGAQVYRNGSLSRTLRDRVMLGIELYKAGKVEKLLVSGDHGRLDYDEVNSMRKFILKRGVPAEDIFMDHAGFDTYDSLYRARAIFEVKSAVLVSQAFHLRRLHNSLIYYFDSIY